MGLFAIIAQSVTDPSALPGYVGGGVVSSTFAFLWWTERKDRKESDDRLRETTVAFTERIFQAIAQLVRATDIVDAYARDMAGRRDGKD